MMRELMIGDKVKAIKEAFAVDTGDCGTVVSIDGVRENPFTHEMESRVTVELESTGIQIDTEENVWALVDDAGRALLPANEAVDVPSRFESLDESVDFWDKKLGKEAPPERLAQDYVDARQKAWDMGAAFVDYKTWLEQRLAGVEVQRDAALARAQAAEANIVEMNKVIELLQSQRDRTREELKQLRKVVADAGIDDSFWNQSLL